jgi:transposase InsO family protein
MPWKETNVMSERREFIKRANQQEIDFSQLCRVFEISRKTGYKWLKRYQRDGVAGLTDQSKRPHKMPNKTTPKLEEAVLGVRRKHPAWGGRKIHARLKRLGYEHVPSPSTITAILQRNGEIAPEESSKRKAYQHFEMEQPNQMWQMDFKGAFRIGPQRCFPLTIIDDCSRYLLGLKACQNQQRQTVKGHLTRVFRQYGLPDAFLVDNGPPWGPSAAERYYTKLNAWMFRLNIRVIHSRPYHPQTLGKNERLHRTLKAEVLKDQDFDDFHACQVSFDTWQHIYNHDRPHEALAMDVPASRFCPSKRPFPEQLPPITYQTNDQVRKVQPGGQISFQARIFRVGRAFAGFPVGVRARLTDGEFIFAAKRSEPSLSIRYNVKEFKCYPCPRTPVTYVPGLYT